MVNGFGSKFRAFFTLKEDWFQEIGYLDVKLLVCFQYLKIELVYIDRVTEKKQKPHCSIKNFLQNQMILQRKIPFSFCRRHF